MKQSSAKLIKAKQSSAYKGQVLKPSTIHAIAALKSFPRSRGVSQAQLDQIAEAKMNQGWKRSKHSICSSCGVMKPLSGVCDSCD